MKSTGFLLFEDSKKVRVNPPPKTGRVSVAPNQGNAFSTQFRIEA